MTNVIKASIALLSQKVNATPPKTGLQTQGGTTPDPRHRRIEAALRESGYVVNATPNGLQIVPARWEERGAA